MVFETQENQNSAEALLNEFQDFAKTEDPDKVGKTLDAKNKDQQLGLAEKMDQNKINSIVNFVDTNDPLVQEYTITGIADGHKFMDGGPNAEAIRKQCAELIRDLGQRMILPTEFQAGYLNTINEKAPNEILALDRGLLVLSQLPQATLDKIGNKLSRDIHTEMIKSGDYRTGALTANINNQSFDITETNIINKIPAQNIDLQVDQNNSLDKLHMERKEEFKNILPRIDFIMQMPNPKNPKETRYFQKQVNTDGTSKTGWYAITEFTYQRAQKHINVIDKGAQSANKPTRFGMARDVISGAGKYDKVLDAMNKDENKNTQIRNATAKEFLSKFTDTPPSDPRLEAFIQKVETSQGKGGFKTFMHTVYGL